MKDRVEIIHLTKFHAFRVNRNQVMDIDRGSKSVQKSLMLKHRPSKPYKLLKFFISFVKNCTIPFFSYHLKDAEMKITYICP